MAAGFADVISALGVWLGGRKAVSPTAAVVAPSSGAGIAVPWPGHGRDDPNVPYAFQDPELVALVRRAVDEALKSECVPPRTERPEKRAEPPPIRYEPATDLEISSALSRLFSGPILSALDSMRAAAAIEASAKAVKLAEMWRIGDIARSAAAALSQDEEDALLAILL